MQAQQLLAALLCASLSSCVLYRADKVKVDHPLLTLENGVEYRDILHGQGPAAQEGDEVSIDYTGYLSSGTQFDSSLERGVPIQFTLGKAPLAGWNTGLLGMQAGGSRKLALPPELAYGKRGIEGLIPPNETLVFEIELLSIDAASGPE